MNKVDERENIKAQSFGHYQFYGKLVLPFILFYLFIYFNFILFLNFTILY